GLAPPGWLAHVAVQKFCDHMPLARQEKFFARHGIELPRSTLTDWMLAIGQATMPLVERMGEWLKRGDILASDDTPLPWQNGRAGKTTTARLWVWRGLVEDCNRCWFTSSPLIARENMRPPSSRAGKAICKPTPTADTIAILSMAASSKLDVSRSIWSRVLSGADWNSTIAAPMEGTRLPLWIKTSLLQRGEECKQVGLWAPGS